MPELMDKRGNFGVEYKSLWGAATAADTTDTDAVDDIC
jgi:hypothetical protein